MKKLQCLIIDDDPTMHKLLEAMIKNRTDWSIQNALDGNVGLEMIKKNEPDVIFCDFHMSGKDGLTVMKELDTFEHNEMIKIFVTSDNQKSVITDAIKNGAHYFINKAKLVDEFQITVDSIKKYFSEK